MVSADCQRVPIPKGNRGFRKYRSREDELSCARAKWIETECGKHIPSAHLTAILVSAKPVRPGRVQVINYFPYITLCGGRITKRRVQPCGGVAWLIAVGIFPDTPCHEPLGVVIKTLVTLREQ